jgi:OmpA family protein
MISRKLAPIAACVALAAVPVGALAQQAGPRVFVSPNNGQTKTQQDADTAACQKWATDQAPPPQAPTGPGTHGRGVAGGAARGAAVGAVGGAIGGDAGKGAAVGAAVGGVAGRRRSKQQQQAAGAQAQDDWARAFAACMQSRGYSVK